MWNAERSVEPVAGIALRTMSATLKGKFFSRNLRFSPKFCAHFPAISFYFRNCVKGAAASDGTTCYDNGLCVGGICKDTCEQKAKTSCLCSGDNIVSMIQI